MMKSVFICILSVGWMIPGIAATDYCSTKICSGRKHIGCQNDGAFSPTCPENQTEMVTITQDLQEKILANHNEKRELIAGGGLAGFESAEKMRVMQWDDELAELAELNVKTCKFAHDGCHDTDEFTQSGQNLAKMWWKGGSFTDEEIILTRIDTWWLEFKNTNMSQLLAYPRVTSKMIGHFTVMTAEKNKKMGCAAIRFPENGMSSLTFACNYAATNYIGLPMYKIGPPGSKCLNGRSLTYPSLCL